MAAYVKKRGTSVKGNVLRNIRHHSYDSFLRLWSFDMKTNNCKAARKCIAS
jgi:hypothetical protein